MNEINQLIQAIFDYDEKYGRPMEGSNLRREAYDKIIALTERVNISENKSWLWLVSLVGLEYDKTTRIQPDSKR